MPPCPLCGGNVTTSFFAEVRREYFQCLECSLVHVPANHHLTAAQERAEYDLHENHSNDPGYRQFLGRVFEPVHERLSQRRCSEMASAKKEIQGLDFGCGPGPTLSLMFEEAGYRVALYDYFYHPDISVLNRYYDFITATEVVEHLSAPGKELDRLWEALKPGCMLVIMTKRVKDAEAFSTWHYKNDPTHICFFADDTFKWLARRWCADLDIISDDVVIFLKGS